MYLIKTPTGDLLPTTRECYESCTDVSNEKLFQVGGNLIHIKEVESLPKEGVLTRWWKS